MLNLYWFFAAAAGAGLAAQAAFAAAYVLANVPVHPLPAERFLGTALLVAGMAFIRGR